MFLELKEAEFYKCRDLLYEQGQLKLQQLPKE